MDPEDIDQEHESDQQPPLDLRADDRREGGRDCRQTKPWLTLTSEALSLTPSTFTMKRISRGLAVCTLTALAVGLHPTSAHADYSKCTSKIRGMGYFITDIDSDWGRPYDKFSAVKNGKEYDIWVNKNTCKVEQTVLDDDRRWYD